MCGEPVDACVCPECPVCGCQGDPACYPTHGLELTDEQREHAAMAAQRDRQAREDAEAEAAYWAADSNRDQEYW